MRFSALFSDSRFSESRFSESQFAESQTSSRMTHEEQGAGELAAPSRNDLDDDFDGEDLAERVRRTGEWQLEDW